MKKIKIKEEQLSLLNSGKRKLVKITEAQLKVITGNQPTTVKAKSLFESKNGKVITSKIVELLEDVFNNPKLIGEDINPLLKEAGIKAEELSEVLNDQAIQHFVEQKYTDGAAILKELNDAIGDQISEMTSMGGAGGINGISNGNDMTYDANAFGDMKVGETKNKKSEVPVVSPGEVIETVTNPSGVLGKKKDGTYKKVSKKDAKYRESDDKQRKCSLCENYSKNKCTNVIGDIKPTMVCEGFEKKKVKESNAKSKEDLIIESLAKRTGKSISEIKEIINTKK